MRTGIPRRSPTPEDNMAHMVKWLHMMREVVLKPEGQPQDGAAPVVQPVQKAAKRRKTDILGRHLHLPKDADCGRFLLGERYTADSFTFQLSGTSGTVHLCVHADPDKPQPKLALVFKGKGTVQDSEAGSYHKDVVVFFQKNAWMTEEVQNMWVDEVLEPHLEEPCT